MPQSPTPEQQADQEEWNKLGCGDCPAKAVQDRQNQANQNIIDLIDWATGPCHSVKDWVALTKGKILSTAGKDGYRSPELKRMPSCIKKAIEWIEESKILTTTSVINTLNLAYHPLSDTPWCCLGNAFAADEANRQRWLYDRLSHVQKRCGELEKKLPPSVTNPWE